MNKSEKDKILMHSKSSISIPVNSVDSSDQNLSNSHYDDAAKGWARTHLSSLYEYIPGIMNPHAKIAHKLNRLFIYSCLFAGFLDSLLLFLFYANKANTCIVVNRSVIQVLIVVRSLTNFISLLNLLIKFRLTYFSGESRILVDHPKKIALNYLSGYFLIDFIVVLPVSQVFMGLILQMSNKSSRADDAVNVLQLAITFQHLAMSCRVITMLSGSGIIFDSWLAKFVINLLGFVFFSHVVGSCWYLFALQRVKECLRLACGEFPCLKYIYCEQGNEKSSLIDDPASWKELNNKASKCFDPSNYNYGIYVQAVGLATNSNLATRYIYSLFWGFQQISTMAGNQIPAFNVLEVVFTMFITATGLVLFSILIGNVQNFLQALGRRSLEMSVRRLDVEQWMSRHLLPEELRRQIRELERYNWGVTRGLNEIMQLDKLPEDLQRDIRRHLFKFVEKFPLFAQMDECIIDAIRERLKQKTYIKGNRILIPGVLIDKMVFIVRGKLESIWEDKDVVELHEGDVCGEELIRLYLKHFVQDKKEERIRIPAHKLLSKRTVRCLTNVQAYTLQAADIEEIISLFSGLLISKPHVHGAIRKESCHMKSHAPNRIKLAWRYRQKRL